MQIKPRENISGEFSLSGDKSITHRAIMLNGCASGTAVISNALVGEDCLSTSACLQALGAKIERDGTTFQVTGTPVFENNKTLDCGNSGTTMRLLTGLVAGKGVKATLIGDASLSKRPMERVAEPLRKLGANIKTENGVAPITVSPAEMHGEEIALKVASAQVKSAILLAGISANGTTKVIEPIKSRDHTERMLKTMGANVSVHGNEITVKKSNLTSVDVCVPADISSAAYFMALGALKGETLCKNVGINPTRTGILKAFDLLGVEYTLQNKRVSGGEEIADIFVKKSNMRALSLGEKDIPSMIDELPLIALLCAFADGESVISGAKELRVKESDRILTTAEMINNLGGDCQATEDGFIIRGKKKLVGGNVKSYLDHRIAMSGTVGLLASEKGGALENPECCAISFPEFYQKLGL